MKVIVYLLVLYTPTSWAAVKVIVYLLVLYTPTSWAAVKVIVYMLLYLLQGPIFAM